MSGVEVWQIGFRVLAELVELTVQALQAFHATDSKSWAVEL